MTVTVDGRYGGSSVMTRAADDVTSGTLHGEHSMSTSRSHDLRPGLRAGRRRRTGAVQLEQWRRGPRVGGLGGGV